MIARDAEPIAHEHRSPYRRIDVVHPGRKRVITDLELANSGDRTPDPAIYRYSPMQQAWLLKEGV